MESAIVFEPLLWLNQAAGLASSQGALLAQVSDPLLRLALYSSMGAVLVSFAMFVAIVVLRARLLQRRRREREIVERWRPVFAQCMEDMPANLPPLAPREREIFLRLWNHFFESIRGAAGVRLVELASRLGMNGYADRLFRRGNLCERLLATVTLGHLRDRTSLEMLLGLASDPSPLLSLAAARASLEIDADEALPRLMPLIAQREDWPLARVSTMLTEVGADRVTQPLADAFERAAGAADPAACVSRLQRLVEVVHAERVMPAVRQVLASATDERIVACCLNALVEPGDVDTVRAYCAHPGWSVRMAAARALGRLGTAQDRARLVDMLGDRHWRVRYHAAQALAGMPFVKIEELKKIRAVLEDRYAADMLGQVIAERE